MIIATTGEKGSYPMEWLVVLMGVPVGLYVLYLTILIFYDVHRTGKPDWWKH